MPVNSCLQVISRVYTARLPPASLSLSISCWNALLIRLDQLKASDTKHSYQMSTYLRLQWLLLAPVIIRRLSFTGLAGYSALPFPVQACILFSFSKAAVSQVPPFSALLPWWLVQWTTHWETRCETRAPLTCTCAQQVHARLRAGSLLHFAVSPSRSLACAPPAPLSLSGTWPFTLPYLCTFLPLASSCQPALSWFLFLFISNRSVSACFSFFLKQLQCCLVLAFYLITSVWEY